ncbi:10594_t:CDS:2 [Entrophospora sp. SA101]|nr:2538_t:CDS:2 [Entrophospora sp. SA101]CAJ0835773.1 10594_t:CDS:2 [Entrophospora sp. SA101]CAJ0913956.1 4202_t:CDS:2 [Entrophospora sp. SA101]CAJ0913974.1 4212_t:CDS:2 [Entrophospora sp. SA101]CAJ0913988.1 4219_t:CDS:2 [Entrophospora sp. SA101]
MNSCRRKRSEEKNIVNVIKHRKIDVNQESSSPTKSTITKIVAINKNEDELMMLNARLIQWCYLNVNNEFAFENQKLSVESQLLQAWKVLYEKRVGLINSLRKFELEKDLININETLEFQKNILTSIIQYLENFKPNYVEFVSSLSKTITAMPIINILTVDLAELTKEIDDCLNVASELLSPQTSNMSESSLLVQNIADTIQNLCNDIKKEFQELTECNNLLRDLYDAEINESSLRIRKLNLLETANS